jgi:hypothetical protein
MTNLESPPVAYQGRADHVWPPYELGWAEVPFHHNPKAVEHAHKMLGSLPPYHYSDAALADGLYRFFAFETPVGVSISALKFVGEAQATALMLGDAASSATYADWVDSTPSTDGGLIAFDGGAIPEDNSKVTGDGTGNAGVKVTPVAYATLQDAAVAMNDALKAHGYRRLDQPIYAGFQVKAGDLTVDAFPGTNTINRLKGVLSTLGVAFASVPVYPWHATTPGGLTGTNAYDGTNAPTWAQWTGQGAAPTVAKAGVASSGGAIAAIAALVVVAGGVIAKSAGKF